MKAFPIIGSVLVFVNISNANFENNTFLEKVILRVKEIYSPETLVYLTDFEEQFILLDDIPKIILRFNDSHDILSTLNSNLIIIIFSNSDDIIYKILKFSTVLESPVRYLLATNKFEIENLKVDFQNSGLWDFMVVSTRTNSLLWTNTIETFTPENIDTLREPPYNFQKLPVSVKVVNRNFSCAKTAVCIMNSILCSTVNCTLKVLASGTSTLNLYLPNSNYTYCRFRQYGAMEIYVPIKPLTLDNYDFFIIVFDYKLWILLIIILISYTIFESFKHGKLEILSALSIAFAQNTLKDRNLIELAFVFFCFITSILYCASFGSSLIQNYSQTTKTILCIQKFLDTYPLSPKFQNYFKIIDEIDYWNYVEKFDQRFGYCLTRESEERLQIYHKRFRKTIFKSLGLGLSSVTPLSITVLKLSPFRKIIDNWLSAARSSGVYFKWDEESVSKLCEALFDWSFCSKYYIFS